MANRLAQESSPYLLQHKDNPVDWYPWGAVALERASAESKPIFLSIGYAACHWCHVMERESFEDLETARLLNDNFVNIKVDREERPDLDAVYMDAIQTITGRGGWPMSVFLTPEGVPFYGGTYFPPTPRPGLPSFGQVLLAVREAWDGRRDDVQTQGARVLEALSHTAARGAETIPAGTLDEAASTINAVWDRKNGGLGAAPKFPSPMVLEFLLRHSVLRHSTAGVDLVEQALVKMAGGGIYDQLGGGFHRYSVDARWAVPHFEKMLYDNAQLAPVYLHAYQITGDDEYRRIATEVLDYLVREMCQPEGGFSASQDADSEGVEGKFFVWTPDELADVLGSNLARRVAAYFGVTDQGNFERGTTVLHVADARALESDELDEVRRRLCEARAGRVRPATDTKVLAAWNGLALAAFAEAARVLQRPDYLDVAAGVADHVAQRMTDDGRLMHSWRNGKARVPAFADDYAAVAVGLLELYASSHDETHFVWARELVDELIASFEDPRGGFFTTADDAEKLVLRPKELLDNSVPAANSLAADACARIALFTGEARYREAAYRALSVPGRALGPHAQGFAKALSTLALLESGPVEIAVVGRPLDELVAVATSPYLPFAALAASYDSTGTTVPLLEGRTPIDGRPTAYVCRGFVCREPITGPDALRAELSGPEST